MPSQEANSMGWTTGLNHLRHVLMTNQCLQGILPRNSYFLPEWGLTHLSRWCVHCVLCNTIMHAWGSLIYLSDYFCDISVCENQLLASYADRRVLMTRPSSFLTTILCQMKTKPPHFIFRNDTWNCPEDFPHETVPYGRRGFNNKMMVTSYRISRGKCVISNTFGIMANQWTCLLGILKERP